MWAVNCIKGFVLHLSTIYYLQNIFHCQIFFQNLIFKTKTIKWLMALIVWCKTFIEKIIIWDKSLNVIYFCWCFLINSISLDWWNSWCCIRNELILNKIQYQYLYFLLTFPLHDIWPICMTDTDCANFCLLHIQKGLCIGKQQVCEEIFWRNPCILHMLELHSDVLDRV